ncbi:hypothetical protein BFS30_17885 [Pedobacter steynii]|uniref:Uncharacterized protein n=1 Tax=Pedobacter steynii TaxID=430522 RepID=A0A1D7QJM1_9SPHI|nr:hypothetical protein BFS30_17885 [Pedobacter steynii]
MGRLFETDFVRVLIHKFSVFDTADRANTCFLVIAASKEQITFEGVLLCIGVWDRYNAEEMRKKQIGLSVYQWPP